MPVLTPSGYRDAADLLVGDEVSAFDMTTGDPIVNTIEAIELVDEAEYDRWWNGQEEQSEFPWRFIQINGGPIFNSEQSIWRATADGPNICHVRDLVVGDTIYDDEDHDLAITSLDDVTALSWWRLEISGDHSYIADGITLHNASRFWVLGTGTWNSSNTANWSGSSGGSGGSSVPGSADTATLDGSSGGGTVTVNTTITVVSIVFGAFTGTLDFATNNNNATLSSASGSGATAMNGSGTGTRTFNAGNGTFTLTGTAATWEFTTQTGLTYNANNSTILFNTSTNGTRALKANNLTLANVTIQNTGAGAINLNPCTISALTILSATITVLGTLTITTLNIDGTLASPALIRSSGGGSQSTISVASGSPIFSWLVIQDIAFTGGATFAAYNSFDLRDNTGITINAPGVTRSRAWTRSSL